MPYVEGVKNIFHSNLGYYVPYKLVFISYNLLPINARNEAIIVLTVNPFVNKKIF